jgi:hypothetical protein
MVALSMVWTVDGLNCQWPAFTGYQTLDFVITDLEPDWPRSGADRFGQYNPPVPLRTTVPVSGIACVVGTPLAVSAPITE